MKLKLSLQNSRISTKRTGFTVAELAVVIVVIAILATITIIVYNSTSQNARESAAKNNLMSLSNQLSAYKNTANNYPEDLSALDIPAKDREGYLYTVEPGGYCLSTTFGSDPVKTFYIDRKNKITEEPCRLPITPDHCFGFDDPTGKIWTYYEGDNDECPRDVTIPIAINGHPVTKIDDNAFQNKDLTSVRFKGSITSIGNYAFQHNHLTSIELPSGLLTTGARAFAFNDIETATIPNTVTWLGEGTFMNNDLTSINIPNSIVSISDDLFRSNKLKSVTIPGSVTSIGVYSFTYNEITSVTIPSSVTSIGEFAFRSNDDLGAVSIPAAASVHGYAFEWYVTITRY